MIEAVVDATIGCKKLDMPEVTVAGGGGGGGTGRDIG